MKHRLSTTDHAKARAATEKLIDTHFKGQISVLARKLGVNRQVIHMWRRRGFVSGPAAACIHTWKLPGMTREALRPDVLDWEWQIKRATEELGYDLTPRKAG